MTAVAEELDEELDDTEDTENGKYMNEQLHTS